MCFCFPGNGFAQDYAISRFTVSGGSGASTNGIFALTGIAGQIGVAKSAGGDYSVDAGFWPLALAVQTPDAPLLRIGMTKAGIEISWSAPRTAGLTLEEAPSLGGVVKWATVTAAIGGTKDDSIVILPTTPGTRFFRLRRL